MRRIDPPVSNPVPMETVEVVHCLTAERVPLRYITRSAMAESRRLAPLYVLERGLPESVELEEIDDVDLVAWLRRRGYEMLDHPIPPYVDRYKRVVLGEWRPR